MRERDQRVAARVDAERERADRVLAQRDEGAAPGRADEPPRRGRHEREVRQAEVVERERRVHRPPEHARPRHVADAVDAAGQPFLVAEDQVDERVERERHEREVVVLHAQRRVAEHPADREARDAAEHVGRPERPALRGQVGGDVRTDPDERGLRERDLPGVAERQVEADGGDRHHRPHAQDEDAVGLQPERRHEEERAGGREHDAGGEAPVLQTVRSSTRPSRPCGRNRMTTIRIRSGIAIRYCEEM